MLLVDAVGDRAPRLTSVGVVMSDSRRPSPSKAGSPSTGAPVQIVAAFEQAAPEFSPAPSRTVARVVDAAAHGRRRGLEANFFWGG
jgi:hypothetical protein